MTDNKGSPKKNTDEKCGQPQLATSKAIDSSGKTKGKEPNPPVNSKDSSVKHAIVNVNKDDKGGDVAAAVKTSGKEGDGPESVALNTKDRSDEKKDSLKNSDESPMNHSMKGESSSGKGGGKAVEGAKVDEPVKQGEEANDKKDDSLEVPSMKGESSSGKGVDKTSEGTKIDEPDKLGEKAKDSDASSLKGESSAANVGDKTADGSKVDEPDKLGEKAKDSGASSLKGEASSGNGGDKTADVAMIDEPGKLGEKAKESNLSSLKGESSSGNGGDKTADGAMSDEPGREGKEATENKDGCPKKTEKLSVDGSAATSLVKGNDSIGKPGEEVIEKKVDCGKKAEEPTVDGTDVSSSGVKGDDSTEKREEKPSGNSKESKMEIDDEETTKEVSTKSKPNDVPGSEIKMEIDDQKKLDKEASTTSNKDDIGSSSEATANISSETEGASKASKDVKPRSKQNSLQEDTSSDDDGDDLKAFEHLSRRTRKKKRKSKKKPKKSPSLHISIPSHTPKEQAVDQTLGGKKQPSESAASRPNNNDAFTDESFSTSEMLEEEEDPLSFYSISHEGQDPGYVSFHSSRLKKRLEAELTKLQKDKIEDMNKIQEYLAAKWEERNDTLQRQINKVRVDMIAKQTRQRNQLSDKHKRQIEGDERKIEEGEKWLLQKQELELQQRMQQHQSLPNNGMIEWNTIAAQLQNRHTFQRQQFEEKKVEMNKRSQQELAAQNQILEAHHKKRQAEAENFIKELADKCRKQQENLKAKLSRLHEERWEKKEKAVRAECTLTLEGELYPCSQDEGQASANQNRLDSPHGKTVEPNTRSRTGKGGTHHDGSVSHDAVLRQKQRKALMNNASIQLAIEIHNEGIIAMTRSNNQEGDKRSSENEDNKFSSDKANGRSSTFIPWGSKARSFLYSIVVGEIPDGYLLDQVGRAGRGALGGGLVKCMITDTRTSEDTAISERAVTLAQVQVAKSKANVEEAERQYTNACSSISALQAECSLLIEKEEKIAAAHKEAALQFERNKAILDKFKSQAQHFFNQDGTPSPRVNPDSQQKLLTAMHKYKSAYESTKSKEATLRQPLELARNALTHKKADIQKLQQDAVVFEQSLRKARQNQAHQSLETTVENVTTTLSKIAEKRRSQVSRNKSNSGYNDSWEESMSSLPEEKKKSFHQKMLRRRITTMLRPSMKTLLGEVKQVGKISESSSSSNKDCFDICGSDDDICPELRAEQLLLLALHPQAPENPLPPVPDQSAPNIGWAEPGWHLILDNPGKSKHSSSILPIETEGHLSQKFLAGCCSSGRQAASLIKPRHLRMLTAPLSFVCQASAPAESNPSGKEKASQDLVDADPLSATDEKIRVGYSFVIRPDAEEPEEIPAIDVKGAVAEKSTKRQRPSKKLDADQKANPPTAKRRKSQTPKSQPSIAPQGTDPRFNSQAIPQNQSIIPPPYTNQNQNLQMNTNQQQGGQYRLLNQNNFQPQQQQIQQQQIQQQQAQKHQQNNFQQQQQQQLLQQQQQLQQQQLQQQQQQQLQQQQQQQQQQLQQQQQQQIQQQQPQHPKQQQQQQQQQHHQQSQQQQQQSQQQQQQFQHLMQMRQLQAQLQLQQQQQQQQPSNPQQMQQMQLMPTQRPQDQQMPFPRQFNQQMNHMIQQNNMGNVSMQNRQQQAGPNPTSAKQQLNKK